MVRIFLTAQVHPAWDWLSGFSAYLSDPLPLVISVFVVTPCCAYNSSRKRNEKMHGNRIPPEGKSPVQGQVDRH